MQIWRAISGEGERQSRGEVSCPRPISQSGIGALLNPPPNGVWGRWMSRNSATDGGGIVTRAAQVSAPSTASTFAKATADKCTNFSPAGALA